MHAYRTTFTPNPFVAKAIQEIARKEGKSISSVVNDLLQSALENHSKGTKQREPFKVEPFSLNINPGIDPTKLREVLFELEIEEA